MGFELRFTDKEITAWGGMGLMKRMLDQLGFEAALKESGEIVFLKALFREEGS